MAAKITIDRIGEMLQTVLRELKNRGGEGRLKEILEAVEPKLKLTPYEKDTYEKSGYVRWESIIHFYSIDCVKAGYLTKSGGKWYLTPEGEQALMMPPAEFMRSAQQKYRAWKSAQPSNGLESPVEDEEKTDRVVRQAVYEQASEQARTEIEEYIKSLGWYEFQKLVAELLIAMGYHISYIAPPGPDGGIDIVAYKDPLGLETPHIKVQVKHREDKAKIQEIRELHGLLKDIEIGLFVSSSGFAKGVATEAAKFSKHIELMDLDRLISLWESHYENIRENGKGLLPLVRLYFLAPVEE